jgi:N-glycosylase/DNA lyase
MKTLNNIFYDENILSEFRKYLTNKRTYQNEKYYAKFKNEPFNKFELLNDEIIYKPNKFIVIESEKQKQEVLDKLFNDDTNTFGKGVVGFYKYVSSKYINITRQQVSLYLATKGVYQMSQSITKRINKPIISKYPNQMWGIDLIDLNDYKNVNANWRYIMTVVDIFSRKVFLNKMKIKEAKKTRDTFNEIINRLDVSPKYLLSDNGNEWLGEFQEYCKEKEIKQIFTRSYSPEANGVVERMNKEVRKIMKAFFIRNNNKEWYNILDKIEDNKNNTYNSTVKNAPEEIWTPDKEEIPRVLPEVFTRNNPKLKAKLSLVRKAIEKINKFKEEDNYQVGNIVRVKMSSIFTNVRKLVKDNKTKQIVVTYTPELFVVNRVIIPRNKLLERKKYILENGDGKILTKNGVTQLFYASELLGYKGENAADVEIDMDMALKLNGVQRNANDVDY